LDINPLNAELNPICHLLALLGGATIVVVSRFRVKDLLSVADTWFKALVSPHARIIKIVHFVEFRLFRQVLLGLKNLVEIPVIFLEGTASEIDVCNNNCIKFFIKMQFFKKN
jgi:hypothetical protein